MEALSLRGRDILVVEDEPLIALDLACSLRDAGANVLRASTLAHARELAERPGLSAAIIDYVLRESDCHRLWQRLEERGIPVILYTGWDFPGAKGAVVIPKPTPAKEITATVRALCAARELLAPA